jgi:hypothetical protein
MAGNAELGSENRGNGPAKAVRRQFLARLGVNLEGVQIARVIFNEMLICSACP